MNNKLGTLRTAANEFAEKARGLSSVIEVAVVGSVAGGDPCPDDLDLAAVLRDLDELAVIAGFARQIAKYYHGWEIFVFDEQLRFLGRVCYRRECPSESIDCRLPCGHPPYLRVEPGFVYDQRLFLGSPIDVLWATLPRSALLGRKEELGLGTRVYQALEDIKIECRACGRTFLLTAQERKWYRHRSLQEPKRCPECLTGLRPEE